MTGEWLSMAGGIPLRAAGCSESLCVSSGCSWRVAVNEELFVAGGCL